MLQARESVERLIEVEGNDQSLKTFAERLQEAQAEFYSNIGRHSDAVRIQGEVIVGRIAKITPEREPRSVSDLAYGQAIYGKILAKARKREEACSAWKEADRLMAELVEQDALSNYVADLRTGVQANIERCNSGAPVESFGKLTG